jgi:transposase
MTKDIQLRKGVIKLYRHYKKLRLSDPLGKACKAYFVGRTSTKQWLRVESREGAIPKPKRKRDYQGKFEHWPQLQSLCLAAPDMFWDERAAWMFRMTGIWYSPRALRFQCARRGWTSKKIKEKASRRDENLRLSFRRVLRPARLGGQFEASQLVVLDEFGKKRKDFNRPNGIAPPGQQPQMVRPYDRFKRRVTVIGAMTIEGVVAAVPIDTTKRGLNAAMFEHALQSHILPLMNPFPQKRSVLVLDGAPVHCKDRIQQMCAQRQTIVLWLPPYSPDFSPIELVFNVTLRKLRRSYGRTWSSTTLMQKMQDALFGVVTAEQACSMFCHCGIEVSPADYAWATGQ